MTRHSWFVWPGLCIAGLSLVMYTGCGRQQPAWDTTAGVLLSPADDDGISEAIKAVVAATPPRIMRGSGLAGAMGGVNFKAQRAGSYDLLLPIPQIADSQVPVFFCVNTKPETALSACRLQVRNDGNAFVSVRLDASKGQEVAIEWSSVILMAMKAASPNLVSADEFLAASPCVQAESAEIVQLAAKLWPATGAARDYAINIQNLIRTMQRRKQPMSLDATGILESGQNTICTANANLACALMRARQIPCRTIATIPTISRRFEMHRIAAYYDQGAWIAFDPSLAYADIPLKPWQNIIMAKTSIDDEQPSMIPRLGSMVGCPFGQQVEFAQPGLNLFGQAFFWTVAAPLAEFEVTDESYRLTADHWKRYLKTGTLSPGQRNALLARDHDNYLEAVKMQ